MFVIFECMKQTSEVCNTCMLRALGQYTFSAFMLSTSILFQLKLRAYLRPLYSSTAISNIN